MPKPVTKPTWDTAGTNVSAPTAGLLLDGWGVNAVPASSHINWLFYWVTLWIDWIDDGIWEAVSLVLTGALTGVKATFTNTAGQVGATVTGNGAAGLDLSANGGTGQTGVQGVGGAGDETFPGGKGGDFIGGPGLEFGGNGGTGLKARGGGAIISGVGGYGIEAEGGLASDGVTYRAAVRALNGNIETANGKVTSSGNVEAGGNLQATANVIASGTASSIALEARQTPTFVNSWVNAFTGGGGEHPAKYWKTPFGEVELEGAIVGGANNTVVYTLPAGYRPPFQMQFPVQVSTGGSLTSTDVGTVTINTSGTVQVQYPAGTGTVYLNTVRFRL